MATRDVPRFFARWRESSPARRILLLTSAVHVTNDACFALLYPLLPLIAADLHLSYTQVGLLRAAFVGAQSALQIPAGMIGERFGEAFVLLAANAWVGFGLVGMALVGTYALLVAAALVAGIGGNAQHPLASAMVSRAFPSERRATALGILNFTGDLGKLLGPLVVGVIAAAGGWRAALISIGGVTALFSLALLARHGALIPPVAVPARQEGHDAKTARTRPGFSYLLLVGALDSATRGGALTFLPFIFTRHGVSAAAASALFGLIFAAGAAGKFACGWLGDRWGVLVVIVCTELATAVAILGFIVAPVGGYIPLALVFGFGLNGTSSVLMAAVAHFVPAHRQASGYGAYYTMTLGSAAVAPLLYGALGDAVGLTRVFLVMAAFTAAVLLPVLPIAAPLRAVGKV